jgi:protocatechuate 3,4-dioxygenase beta subunit
MNNKQLLFISLLWLLFSALITGCSHREAPVTQSLETNDAHTLVLTSPDEPGQSLTLSGTVTDNQTGQPLPGTRIYLYHADANGEYLPADPDDESTARLSGEVITGDTGQFTVHTIVPREYDMPGNRHIHLHYVRADGYQDFGAVILFENDVNPEIRQWANDTGFGIIIELEEVDGGQQGSVTIPLDPVN